MVVRWFCVRCYHLCVSASRRFPQAVNAGCKSSTQTKVFELLYPYVPTKEPVERVECKRIFVAVAGGETDRSRKRATSPMSSW